MERHQIYNLSLSDEELKNLKYIIHKKDILKSCTADVIHDSNRIRMKRPSALNEFRPNKYM